MATNASRGLRAELEQLEDELGLEVDRVIVADDVQEPEDIFPKDDVVDQEDRGPALEGPTRWASRRLYLDQRRALLELLAGFDDEAAVLEWFQDLVIATLGELPDEWFFRDVVAEPTVMAALLEREVAHAAAPPASRARETRTDLAVTWLLPAYHDAHAEFATTATERVDHLDAESDSVAVELTEADLGRQYPAMRPGLAELDERQRSALDDLLEGFDSPEALAVWAHSVTYGTAARTSRSTMTEPYFSKPLRRAFVAEAGDESAAWYRRAWAAKYLLPAFNRAARALAAEASEVTVDREVGEGFGSASIS